MATAYQFPVKQHKGVVFAELPSVMKALALDLDFITMLFGVVKLSGGELVHDYDTNLQRYETLVGGWATLYYRDRDPFYCSVSVAEFGGQGKRYKDNPGRCLARVAMATAIRCYFPNLLRNAYIPEEFQNAG